MVEVGLGLLSVVGDCGNLVTLGFVCEGVCAVVIGGCDSLIAEHRETVCLDAFSGICFY